MKKQRASIVFTLLLVIGDVIAILGAYSVAYILRVKLSDAPVAEFVAARPYFLSLLTLLPFIVLLFVLIGTYRNIEAQRKLGQIVRVIVGAFGAMLFLITLDYFYNEPIFPAKLVPIYALGLSVAFLAACRAVLYTLRWLWWRREHNLQTVVIIGDNAVARNIATSVARRNSGYKVMGVIGDRRLKFTTHRTFAEAVQHGSPDIVVQVATNSHPTIDADLLQYSLEHYAEFKFVPSDVNDLPNKVNFDLFMGDIPVMSIQQTALVGWGRVAKRAFDIAASATALLLLSPIFLIMAILNRVIFGKVVFGHTRLTRGNRPFTMYKFQSIPEGLSGLTPEEAFRKLGKPELIKQYRDNGDYLDNDPRFGAWGRFIRKLSLDELPQFWNVLKGDISLVGPRALIPEELSDYEQKHLILNVKSGITGLAQISGRRNLPWEQRRRLDIYYVQNWSFGMDIQILLSTAWQVVMGRGAQ